MNFRHLCVRLPCPLWWPAAWVEAASERHLEFHRVAAFNQQRSRRSARSSHEVETEKSGRDTGSSQRLFFLQRSITSSSGGADTETRRDDDDTIFRIFSMTKRSPRSAAMLLLDRAR